MATTEPCGMAAGADVAGDTVQRKETCADGTGSLPMSSVQEMRQMPQRAAASSGRRTAARLPACDVKRIRFNGWILHIGVHTRTFRCFIPVSNFYGERDCFAKDIVAGIVLNTITIVHA